MEKVCQRLCGQTAPECISINQTCNRSMETLPLILLHFLPEMSAYPTSSRIIFKKLFIKLLRFSEGENILCNSWIQGESQMSLFSQMKALLLSQTYPKKDFALNTRVLLFINKKSCLYTIKSGICTIDQNTTFQNRQGPVSHHSTSQSPVISKVLQHPHFSSLTAW